MSNLDRNKSPLNDRVWHLCMLILFVVATASSSWLLYCGSPYYVIAAPIAVAVIWLLHSLLLTREGKKFRPKPTEIGHPMNDRIFHLCMLILFVVATASSSWLLYCGSPHYVIAAPIAVAVIWLFYSLILPRGGKNLRTIPTEIGHPRQVALSGRTLVKSALLLSLPMLLFLATAVIDVVIFNHAFEEPLEVYHFALYLPTLVLFLVAITIFGRYVRDLKRDTQEEIAKEPINEFEK
jgi:hypothetical protein